MESNIIAVLFSIIAIGTLALSRVERRALVSSRTLKDGGRLGLTLSKMSQGTSTISPQRCSGWACSRDLELNSTTSLNMRPSRSRLEREDPPPRRKSCHACVKAKRRCDQRQPTCTRCSQRKIACHFSSRPARSPVAPTNPSSSTLTELAPDNCVIDGISTDFLASAYNSEPVSHPWPSRKPPPLCQLGLPEAPTGPLYQSSQFGDGMSSGLALDDLDIPGHGDIDPDLLFDFTNSTMPGKEVALRTPLGVSTVQRRLDLAALHAALETNFSYAVDRIKTAPSAMLLENQAPWCHPLLYKDRMPREMQEAISTCALHASKNEVNSRVIMSCIEAKVDELLSSSAQVGALDALARTQALILHQSIRFFDGDVLARSSADTTFCELESAIHVLREHVSWDAASGPETTSQTAVAGDADGPFLATQPSRQFWESWVYQESARRTFLIASFFVHIWKMLTGQPLVHRWGDEELARQCWTLSAHLWEASDALDFAAAWRDRKHHVVRRGMIRSTVMDAGPGDLDVFGKMLMTAALGVDETKEWLGAMGARL